MRARATPLTAEQLVLGGFFQVSQKYRWLARLPYGKTAIEALTEAELAGVSRKLRPEIRTYWLNHYPKWARGLGEGSAGDYYLRTHSERRGLLMEVTPAVWDAYVALRAERAEARTYDQEWHRRKRLGLPWPVGGTFALCTQLQENE